MLFKEGAKPWKQVVPGLNAGGQPENQAEGGGAAMAGSSLAEPRALGEDPGHLATHRRRDSLGGRPCSLD